MANDAHQWKECDIENIKPIITDICTSKCPGAFITLTHKETPPEYGDRRLYIWKNGININMFCYEVDNAPGASISIDMSSTKNKDEQEKINVNVFSAHDARVITPKSISLSSCYYYDTIVMGFGVYMFNIGETCHVYVDDDGWNAARVLQLTSNPTRAIFVTSDARQLIISVNLDFPNADSKVRMPSQIEGVAPANNVRGDMLSPEFINISQMLWNHMDDPNSSITPDINLIEIITLLQP
jgi:hypothetical protein